MLPRDLNADRFAAYPEQARVLATKHLDVLRRLPLAFVPLLLRELIVFDWKFPAERADLERQFAFLNDAKPDALQQAMAPFAQLKLTRELEQVDWVNSPAAFSEQLSAHLWATHQIDTFRTAAFEYVQKAVASAPDGPLPVHRLGIAVIGQGATSSEGYQLFRKLSAEGTHFTKVGAAAGLPTLLHALEARAAAHPAPYGHWYIDGGDGASVPDGVTKVAYRDLSGPLRFLQGRMQKTYEASVFDPEAFRSMMARIQPAEAGFTPGDEVLNRYQLSLLTEGSGTQVFSTTFVQWAAREALRRAQPLTLLARFAPRQREKQMNELLGEQQRATDADPRGSLVDADMGAWYTWLNQRRLAGEDKAAFLAWFEGHEEAVLIGPRVTRGKRDEGGVELRELIGRVV